MIDFHTHILPGIDDGSKDIQMTEQMLEKEAASGVTLVYATPHFYAHRTGVSGFLERREASCRKVKALLDERKDLHTPKLCVEGTNILLLEMPFEQWTDEVYKDTKDLIQRRGLQVILAHVERYTGFQKDREIWDRVMDLPVTIQMNAGSFLKFGMTRHFCRTLLRQEAGRVIIGSDCHNLTSRPPNLAQAMAFIRQKEGEEIARKIEETENRLFCQPM